MPQFLLAALGGTIDALEYDHPAPDIASFNKEGRSAAIELAKTIAGENLRAVKICLKDSKDLEQEDLSKLVETINTAKEEIVIVTIGTDKTISTGKMLELLAVKTKTIILTGAMWPIANGEESDGLLNIIACFEEGPKLPHGVYVLGKQRGSEKPGIFNINNVRKNFQDKVFEEIEPSKSR